MFRVIYNGYTIDYVDTAEDAEKYIFDKLEEYKQLNPKLIFHAYGDSNQAAAEDIKYHDGGFKIKSVMIFQYKTLYTEMFMIQERV